MPLASLSRILGHTSASLIQIILFRRGRGPPSAGGRSAAKLLSEDEARRLAANIAITLPPLSAASKGGTRAGADLLQSHWLGATRIRVYMGGLRHVAREESFKAKRAKEGRNSIGSRGDVGASGRRGRGCRWSGRRYTDGEHGNYSR